MTVPPITIPRGPVPAYTPNAAPEGSSRAPFAPGHDLGALGLALDPSQHPEAHPAAIDQQIHGQPQGAGSGMLYTPGMMPMPLPPSLVGGGPRPIPGAPIDPALTAPPSPQSMAVATQGTTPEAAALAQQDTAQRQITDETSRRKALKAIYGDDFPVVLDREPNDSDWFRWVTNRWALHQPGIQHNIWMAERNRQFRAGYQYQSRLNSAGAWRETPIPKDAVRIVDNRIRPALAWAMQVVAEQRPGWQFKPTNTDADRERKADAQQRAVEYQYDAQKKRLIDRESVYWAQTDGVSFQMTYWDPDQGPWEELEQGRGPVPLGEPCTRVFRIEQVRVSSEATGAIAPMYWIVRDILPIQYAVSLYGPEVADDPDQALLSQNLAQFSTTNQYAYQPLFQNQLTTSRYFIFCEKREWMPEGLTAVVVGRKLVYGPTPLLMGRVPMVRVTDGSEDPAFFPPPKMNLLVPAQMRVNMLWSKWYESIRKNSGGRFATKTNAVSAETFIGGETSLLEVRTTGDIRESIQPVPGFSVGNDIKEALDREIGTIEELTGYTKEARGQFEADQSGRAILAQRETLERVFAPQVGALAEANTEWAKQMVGWMRFGYQMPRKISVLGKNRADLAMELTSADLDGIVDVTVDPATMIPKPQALRQWELDNAYDRQIITKDEWRERSLFGNVRDFQTPNDIQYAKAKRVSEQIRLGQPVEPVVWQDDESIQQNVLERDLILAGGIDDQARMMATQRWQQLADQASQKHAPQPQPGSAAANYQAFIQTAVDEVKAKADQLLAQAAQHAMGIIPMPTPAGVGGPNQPNAPHAPNAPHGKAPPKGQPLDPRTAPVIDGNPSAGGESAFAKGGPGVSTQERTAAQFESRALQ